jgi:YVTN family beta-propeller protein
MTFAAKQHDFANKTSASDLRPSPRRVLLASMGLLMLLGTPSASASPFAYISESRDMGGIVTGNTVSVIDTATHMVVDTVIVGDGPVGVAVSPTGDRVYVANAVSSNLSVIDATTNPPTVLPPIAIGVSPYLRGVAVSHSGRYVYVTNYVGPGGPGENVYVIDTATNAIVKSFSHGGAAYGLAAHPNRDLLYLQLTEDGAGGVSVIDTTATGTYPEVARVSFGTTCGPSGIAVDPRGTFVYVPCPSDNALYKIDTESYAFSRIGSLPNANHIAVHPSGRFLYVTNDSNGVYVVDTSPPHGVETILVDGRSGVGFDPTGKFAYVPNYNSNTVSVIDTGNKNVIKSIPVGDGPHGFGAFIVAANTLQGTDITVAPSSTTKVTFSSVSTPGVTTATASSTGPTQPSGFYFTSPPTFIDIGTSATFSGSVTVCISYDPVQFTDPTALSLLHFQGGAWADVTSSIDTTKAVICGQVASFSPFALAQRLTKNACKNGGWSRFTGPSFKDQGQCVSFVEHQ